MNKLFQFQYLQNPACSPVLFCECNTHSQCNLALTTLDILVNKRPSFGAVQVVQLAGYLFVLHVANQGLISGSPQGPKNPLGVTLHKRMCTPPLKKSHFECLRTSLVKITIYTRVVLTHVSEKNEATNLTFINGTKYLRRSMFPS